MKKQTLLIIIVLAIIVGYFTLFSSFKDTLSLAHIQQNITQYKTFIADNFAVVMIGYFLAYVLVTVLSLPFASLMTVTAGAVFGVVYGVLVVSFASTIGASLLFLVSRYILSNSIKRKFPDVMQKINGYMEGNHGATVFALRLVPLFPFFVVNLVLSVTTVRLRTFYIFSQLGMFPATVVYVNAGTQLSTLQSMDDIVSPTFILSFVALGLLPFLGKIVNKKLLQK